MKTYAMIVQVVAEQEVDVEANSLDEATEKAIKIMKYDYPEEWRFKWETIDAVVRERK